MSKKQILIPSYFKDFKCSNVNCIDSCCIGWKIYIDKTTYSKYKNIHNSDLRNLILNNINKNRHAKSNSDAYKIKLNSNQECPLLDNGLCTIQKNLGEDYLSSTCKSYPRVYNLINDSLEGDLSLTCIEAAKNCLSLKQGIDFFYEDVDNFNFMISKNINTTNSNNLFNKSFWELRVFIISLLQNRSYSIEERLLILVLFLNDLNSCKNTDDIINLISRFENNISNNLYSNCTNIEGKNFMFYFNFIKDIITSNLAYTPRSNRFLTFLNNFSNSFKSDSDIYLFEKILKDDYYKIIKNYDYILENYLVYYIYSSLFLTNTKSSLEHFSVLITNFTIIKATIIGCIANNIEISESCLIELINSFSSWTLNNTNYPINIDKYFKSNNFLSLPYLASLVII